MKSKKAGSQVDGKENRLISVATFDKCNRHLCFPFSQKRRLPTDISLPVSSIVGLIGQ